MFAIIVAFAAFVSTVLGGVIALRYRDRLHRILGFTAGVLLAVVTFDLLPEIFALTNSTHTEFTVPMLALVVGFLTFHAVEKCTIIHTAHEGEFSADHTHPKLGLVSALALSVHSFFDGVGIGLGFQISTSVGVTVALAVIAHDFSDGLNTVALLLVNGSTGRRNLWLLLLDASTPIAGAISTLFIRVGDRPLLLYLGFFAGFLLYIGASDILPEAHANHPSGITLLLTVAGTVFIFIVTRIGIG